jgi:hypothetical protein
MPKRISAQSIGRRGLAVAALGALLLCLTLLAAPRGAGAGAHGDTGERAGVPRVFWGVGPQSAVPASDYTRMKRIGVDSVRTIFYWPTAQPSPRGGFDWGPYDALLVDTSRRGLEVFPVLYGTPGWLAGNPRTLPVRTVRQRRAWARFVKAAVRRYGPQGSFWQSHPGLPKRAIHHWQVWNEPNFHYFAKPVSPGRYAALLKRTSRALRSADRGAQVILGGLFGRPRERPPLAYSAVAFLRRLYAVRGTKAAFDAVALHPFARSARNLPGIIGGVRRVMRQHGDRRTALWITEIGWGSARDTAFEKGLRGQARELRRAFRLLLARRRAWRIRRVYWFSWDDVPGSCSFCDSTGLVRVSGRPKPSYSAYRSFAKGN